MSGTLDTGWIESRFAPVVSVTRVAADASVREFYRLDRSDDGTALLMIDEPGGDEALARLLAAHSVLSAAGVPLPAILDHDAERHAVMFEDLGDTLLADALDTLSRAERQRIYVELATIAGRIARRGTPIIENDPDHPLNERPLGRDRMRIELGFFAVHEVNGRRGVVDRDLLRHLGGALDQLADDLAAYPTALAHRDFHARNVMLEPDGTIGIVDFQDALVAPMYYDLVSLLLDPYVELPDEVISAALKAYRQEMDIAIDPFEDPRFQLIAIQRLLKAIGTYAYQITQKDQQRFRPALDRAVKRVLDICSRSPTNAAVRIAPVLRGVGFSR